VALDLHPVRVDTSSASTENRRLRRAIHPSRRRSTVIRKRVGLRQSASRYVWNRWVKRAGLPAGVSIGLCTILYEGTRSFHSTRGTLILITSIALQVIMMCAAFAGIGLIFHRLGAGEETD
jgi:hypothetical protein